MQNGTIIQFFHWYSPSDGTLWKFLKAEAPRLAEMGITAVWMPPASKGSKGVESEGYDLYDLYDLGEFDQKNTVRTKYGTKQEFVDATAALREAGVQIYVDVIANHLCGADETEIVKVRKVNPDNRTEFISDPYEIEAYTKFTFPGRQEKYSAFKWDFLCFTGVDLDKKNDENAIFSIVNEYGEGWEDVADNEFGNFDYLLGADIEFRNNAVREEFKRWGDWFWNLIQFDGVRLDAVKHIPPGFITEWLDHLEKVAGRNLFAVGEYWAPEKLEDMLAFLDIVTHKMSLFDAPLQHNFYNASCSGKEYDLRTIFDNTLVKEKPEFSVTLVGNHDTQPLQLLEAPVEDWFKELAYAFILLRDEGYPCVFYPDLYGAKYSDKNAGGGDCEITLNPVQNLGKLITARKLFAYGKQTDYFDFPTCVGWVREGDDKHAGSGCAVVLSNAEKGSKKMYMGTEHAGHQFYDYLENVPDTVTIQDDGWGEFYCEAGSVSVWVRV